MSWVVEHLHRDGSVMSRHSVLGEAFTIGRSLDNDLVLDDAHVAPRHAQLAIEDDHTAVLRDLGSLNGIALARTRRAPEIRIENDRPVRLGTSWIRVRSSAWALTPELPLSNHRIWALALLALIVVLVQGAWDVWLEDIGNESPPYLYPLAGIAGMVCLWSAAYALYGRLASGADRFFNHLLIACIGYLGLNALDNLLSSLAFASGWLWPLQWLPYLMGLIVALTVRAHLRTADPRHWPSARWALGLVTAVAMAVPLAQQWISHKEFTAIHTMDELSYPALRWAGAKSMDNFLNDLKPLQQTANAARKVDADSDDSDANED